MKKIDIESLLAKNRTEEFGYDVWSDFVISPLFGKLALGSSKKPRVIEGGRGCGKTMLLRYLSYESWFSDNRPSIPEDSIEHIGIYWRADTQFAKAMQARGIDGDVWSGVFRHYSAIVLSLEVVLSVKKIAESQFANFDLGDFNALDFSALKGFDGSLPTTALKLIEYLDGKLIEFEMWINDVRGKQKPALFPGDKFVNRVIRSVRQAPALEKSNFFVYLDEYENLVEYQQRIINTWLKHSEPPLIFNLAMKRNGFKTRDTEGEPLTKTQDYRTVDLEDFGTDSDFAVFAAEIFLLHLLRAGDEDINFVNVDTLRDPERLETRSDKTYRSSVLDFAQNVLPAGSHKELAAAVFQDRTLLNRLRKNISEGLRCKGQDTVGPDLFLDHNHPMASVIVPALLSRSSLKFERVKDEFEAMKKGAQNSFTGTADWVHNNFVGCYLQLFDGLVRPCPIYSGFQTYCALARGNLRHFLELCHTAVQKNCGATDGVSVETQAAAASQVSSELLSEARSFGHQGNNLHAFILRIGTLFSLSQQRRTQSEPERNHFSVKGGTSEFPQEAVGFLSEAVKWSVLYEAKETKKKSDIEPEVIEYVLNPIYAPYFHISYRKKRKVEFSKEDALVLCQGEYEEVRQLLKDYKLKWSVSITEENSSLFSHLEDQS